MMFRSVTEVLTPKVGGYRSFRGDVPKLLHNALAHDPSAKLP